MVLQNLAKAQNVQSPKEVMPYSAKHSKRRSSIRKLLRPSYNQFILVFTDLSISSRLLVHILVLIRILFIGMKFTTVSDIFPWGAVG